MQDSQEYGVEGSHIQIACHIHTHQTADTLLHLTGSLVGEGKRQDSPRLVALADKIRYLVCQHTRLARSCTCNNKFRTVNIFHRSLLALAQRRKKICHDYGIMNGYVKLTEGYCVSAINDVDGNIRLRLSPDHSLHPPSERTG